MRRNAWKLEERGGRNLIIHVGDILNMLSILTSIVCIEAERSKFAGRRQAPHLADFFSRRHQAAFGTIFRQHGGRQNHNRASWFTA